LQAQLDAAPSGGGGGDWWAGTLRRLAAVEEVVPGNAAGGFSVLARGELHSAEMHHTLSHGAMLDIVRQLTGAEDICLPGNYAVRCKGPSAPVLAAGSPDGATVPWHQDACYVNPDAQDSIAVTVWMPLCESTAENGTMQYVRGGHIGAVNDPKLRVSTTKNGTPDGRTLEHVREEGYGVAGAPPASGYMILTADRLPDGEVVTVEVGEGEMILSSNIIPHRSTANLSDGVRLSCDWRMQDLRLPHGWAREAGSTAGTVRAAQGR
jgi:hypothetical protein